MVFIFLVMAMAFAILAWQRLDWALRLAIVLLPSYLWRVSIFGWPTTWLEMMILICAAVWLIKNRLILLRSIKNNWAKKQIARPYPWTWELVVLLIVSWLAVGVSHFSWAAMGLWRAYFLEPILFYLLAFNVLGADKSWKKIIAPLSWSAVLVAVVAWYQRLVDLRFLNPVWSEQGRATSIFPYSNAVGLYLAPIILLLIGFWLVTYYQKNEKLKISWLIFYALTIFLSLGAIIFAQSDGALIGLAAGAVVFGLLANKKLASATIILVLVGVGVIYAQPALKDGVGRQLTLHNLSGEIRRLQWRETFKMLNQDQRWLWGAGLAGYARAVAPFHQEGLFFNRDNEPDFKAKTIMSAQYRATHWQPVEIYLYPHNIFLNFWSELGLLGLLLFVWIFIKFVYLSLQALIQNSKFKIQNSKTISEKYAALGLLCALIVIIVHGLVDVPYFKNDLSVFFWLLLAMLGLVNLRNKK